jgi:hypothetical protein
MEKRELQEAEASSESVPTEVKAAFIVGVPRSGTTLLVNLMGMHPQLAAIYETRFLRNLLLYCEEAAWHWGSSPSRRLLSFFAERWIRPRFADQSERFRQKAIAFDARRPEDAFTRPRYNLPLGPQSILYTTEDFARETDLWLNTIARGSLSEAAVYESARRYVETLFSIHCARMNKPYWINKTPGLLTYLHCLPKLFPSAKSIHIIRDGRDVAVSTMARPWGAKTVQEAARRWKNLFVTGRKRATLASVNYIEVRYEELVESPGKVLQELFAFLDLHANLDEILSRVQVSRDSVGNWKTKFSHEERRIFGREAGDLLIKLGYEKDETWIG